MSEWRFATAEELASLWLITYVSLKNPIEVDIKPTGGKNPRPARTVFVEDDCHKWLFALAAEDRTVFMLNGRLHRGKLSEGGWQICPNAD
jgi:hypothetical protein